MNKNILLQVSGSIAAFKAISLTSKLVQQGYQVEVILTASAEEFIGVASFEGMTGKAVHHSQKSRAMFTEGAMMAYIKLEQWADLILTYPASAHTVSSFASGQSDSLTSTIFLTYQFKKPYWVAPAMNSAMWSHPATQENVKKLSAWGIQICMPEEEKTAGDEVVGGRILEPEEMLDKIEQYFKKKD